MLCTPPVWVQTAAISCQYCRLRQGSDISQLCASTGSTPCRPRGSAWPSFRLVQESAKSTESYALCLPQKHQPLRRRKQLPLLQYAFVSCIFLIPWLTPTQPAVYLCNFFVPVSVSWLCRGQHKIVESLCLATHLPLLKHQNQSCLHSRHGEKDEITP